MMKTTLKNGIRLVMEPLPYVQSAAIGIWVGAGSCDETEREAGISHVIEHMLFKGTETRSALEIAADTDALGANANAFTGKEATCYYIRTLTSHAREASEILLDMFLRSKFDPKELEREKRVIYEEMKMCEDSPEDYAHDLLSEIVFRGTNLERGVIGTRASVAAITRDDILAYRAREYSPGKILVSIAGNFDPDEMTGLFSDALGGFAAPEAERKETPLAYKPEFLCKIKDVEQSNVCMGLPSVPIEHELYYPMHVLSSILGGSMSSRLFQEIREKRGLAYSVFSSLQCYPRHGMFEIYAGVGHDRVDETVSAVADVLRTVGRDLVTESELRTAKEQLKAGIVYGRESTNSRMIANGRNEILLGREVPAEEILRKTDAVTMESLRAAADLVTDPSRYSVVVVGDRDHDF
ncbi:MAG: insulinase family protein, partial [Firmicutes bacterium]|nr:insulinase family protein [Bacillota bacterium]